MRRVLHGIVPRCCKSCGLQRIVWCAAATVAESKAAVPQPEPAEDKPQAAAGGDEVPVSHQMQVKRHPKLYKLAIRELVEEQLRDDKPPKPMMPKGWHFFHNPGESFFQLKKRLDVDGGSLEELKVKCTMELKDYEKTYRLDDGERDENEHLTFYLFVSKPESAVAKGGLEFTLTCVEGELVFDALTIHRSPEDFENAWQMDRKHEELAKLKYRGPSVNELDEDFVDELLDYLDDRGVNNAFADFITAQAYFTEYEEYRNWLELLRRFAD